MKIIEENPFRILGVYANASKKDIVANKSRASAFLKINKSVSFPLDLNSIMPPVERTLEMMNAAEAHLSIAKEQLKYVQFWFLKMTPFDDIAFNNLLAGDMVKAHEIWSRQESLSSLQNRLVCCLVENKLWLAIKLAEKLYGRYGDTYISNVDSNSTLQMSGVELLHLFIDSLGEEFGMRNLLKCELSDNLRIYVNLQTVEPLINQISAEVESAKRMDRKDAVAMKSVGQRLMIATQEPLAQLKNLLNKNDLHYQMIADKLGLEILQCGIDYFNNSEDDDAPHTAMKLQKYAQSIVVGTLAKQRCEENGKILQRKIDELPPKEVVAEDKTIKIELAKFVHLPGKIMYAIVLLNNTKPYLQSIKQKLGTTNEYYLKKSTQIVGNALHNVIEEVNEAQEPLARLSEMLGKMDPTMRSILLSGNNLLPGSNDIVQKIRESEEKVKSTLREAWKATLLMDEFEIENDFKARYRENRNTLKSMCNKMGISTSSPKTIFAPWRAKNPNSTSTSNTSTKMNSNWDEIEDIQGVLEVVSIIIIEIVWLIIAAKYDGGNTPWWGIFLVGGIGLFKLNVLVASVLSWVLSVIIWGFLKMFKIH